MNHLNGTELNRETVRHLSGHRPFLTSLVMHHTWWGNKSQNIGSVFISTVSSDLLGSGGFKIRDCFYFEIPHKSAMCHTVWNGSSTKDHCTSLLTPGPESPGLQLASHKFKSPLPCSLSKWDVLSVMLLSHGILGLHCSLCSALTSDLCKLWEVPSTSNLNEINSLKDMHSPFCPAQDEELFLHFWPFLFRSRSLFRTLKKRKWALSLPPPSLRKVYNL